MSSSTTRSRRGGLRVREVKGVLLLSERRYRRIDHGRPEIVRRNGDQMVRRRDASYDSGGGVYVSNFDR